MTDNEDVSFNLLFKIITSDTAEELRQVCAEYEKVKESFSEWQKEVIIQSIESAKKREEENAKREEENAKRAGVFYARIDELFISESESVNKLKLLKTPEMKSL